MDPHTYANQDLAAQITRSSSKQTYYTIRLLADKKRVADAYRAYAYFRWVDDRLDAEAGTQAEKFDFLRRQCDLLETCYLRQPPEIQEIEETMLVDLVANDHEADSGLRTYLHDMMAVMAFDVERRGRRISQAELSEYSRLLATAVMEALHYFIGHDCVPPSSETRYLAVQGAHVAHMLRDTYEDAASGYYNIASEFLDAKRISPTDLDSPAYREWASKRVQLARAYFRLGRGYIAQVKNLRCRLAGYAYTARFEWMLGRIERDGYRLRKSYPERKGLRAGLWMLWTVLTSLWVSYWDKYEIGKPALRSLRRMNDEI
jgi:phytoene/squalene synthetase